MPAGTVMSSLSRARGRLRQALTGLMNLDKMSGPRESELPHEHAASGLFVIAKKRTSDPGEAFPEIVFCTVC